MDNRYGGYQTQKFLAEYYDAAYVRGPGDDVAFFTESAKNAKGRTLELGCGTGRVLVPAAESGCEITGLDISAYMLDKCREKLAKLSENTRKRARLIKDNMAGFKTGEKYALITIPSRSFVLLVNTGEQKACLRSIHEHLDKHGLVIIPLFSPNPPPEPQAPAEHQSDPVFLMPDGRKISKSSRVTGRHPELQYNDIEVVYKVTSPDGCEDTLVQSLSVRSFYRYEVAYLLDLCGFKVVDLYGDYDKSPFTGESPEMIFVAGKK